MDAPLMTAIIIVSFLAMILLGLPVAFCLLGTSIIFAAIFIDPAVLYTAYSQTFDVMTQDIFVAVPLFVFMATVLQFSGLAGALYDMMYKWFAGLRGGLAIGTIVLCTLIAAMTGLGGTGVVTIGYLAFPEMEKRGYSRSISLGCIPPGGALGPLIPPSVLMIVIGGFAQLSVGRLFMGGVFPGLLMSFFFVMYIGIRAWLRPNLAPALPLEERATWKEKFIALRGVILAIALIFLVLGTIYTGVCTPTEAGGIGAFGALICSIVYRQFTWQNIKSACITALKVNAMVMWLLIGGNTFKALLTMTGVAHYIGAGLTGWEVSPMAILAMMMVIALFMGMLMDGAAITMILIPIFMPVVFALGFDPLWFALLFTINMIIGYVSPPFGMNLFYTKGIVPKDVTMAEIYRSVLPYTLLMLAVLAISVLWPPLLLWLPSTMIK